MNKSYQFKLTAILCFLLLGLPALAQTISYSALYDNSTFPRTIDLSKPVGAIDGSAGSGQMGDVTYSIPIKCPPGTNGMVPKISIEYNSQSGNGLLGKGWHISGLSAITRTGVDEFHAGWTAPVHCNNQDVFLLDGAYLFANSGSYGSSGTTYKTEAESYSVATSSGSTGGGPAYFTVVTKDGTIMEYGNDPTGTAKMMSTDGTVVVMWLISKIQDINGNYMTFTYSNSNLNPQISKISYTGNTVAAVSPYNEINFYYATRTDDNIIYDGGATKYSNYLLNQIEIKAEGDVSKLYQFNYGKNKEISYLKNVQEFEHAGGASLNDTRFQYGPAAANDLTITTDPLAFGTTTSSTAVSSGDFDGDGLSDFLINDITYFNHAAYSSNLTIRKRTAASATYVTTATLSLDTRSFAENVQYKKTFSPIISDVNGDGRDDIIISHSSYTGDDRYLDWVHIYYSDASGGLPAMPSYSYTPSATYRKIHTGINYVQNYFYAGDFDGDGRADFITILDGQLYFTAPEKHIVDKTPTAISGLAVPTSFSDADGVYVINFDGDAKSDLMIVQGGATRIYTLNFNTAADIMSFDQIGTTMTYPTSTDVILTGDFNGDGKTDLLTGPRMSATPNNQWRIGYSTGSSFNDVPFIFDHTVNHIFDLTTDPPTPTDNLCVGDFNGDGMSDIFDYYFGLPTRKCYVYSSTGADFTSTVTPTTAISSMWNAFATDINGDGRADISGKNSSLLQLSFSPFDQSHLLSKVTDGFNNTTSFVYGPLTYGSTGTGNFYTKGTGEVYPVNNVQTPMYVLTSMVSPDGIGGTNTTWYGYENLRLHRAGKGYMGFEKTKAYNVNADLRTESISDMQRSLYVPYQKTVKTYLNSTGAQLSQIDNTYAITSVPVGIVLYGSYTQQLSATVSQDFVTGISNTTNNTYDGYSNVTNSTSVVSGGPETFTTIVANTFVATGSSPIPNSPSEIVTTNQRGTQPSLASKTIYEYTGTGLLLRNTEQSYPSPATPLIVSQYYTYDNYGNIATVQKRSVAGAIASSLWPTTQYFYDTKGRFVTRETNPVGNFKDILTDKFWGKPLSVTGINGLTTTNTYDSWGKITSTTIPTSATTNYTVSYSDAWDVSGNQLYYVNSTDPTAPDIKTWYDGSGRVLKTQQETFGSAWTTALKTYDAKGRVATSTNNYLPSETPLTTTNTYDAMDRITAMANAFGTTNYAYATGSGLTTTTVTAPDGKITITAKDASGLVLRSTNGIAGTVYYTYDSRGNELSTALGTPVMPYQNLTSKTWDDAGNMTRLTDADAGTTTYVYNAFGQLVSKTDPLSKVSAYLYDVLGNVIQKTLDGYVTAYQYYTNTKDYQLKQEKVTLPAGAGIVQDDYDYITGAGMSLHSRQAPGGPLMQKKFTYDANGNLSTTEYVNSGFKTKQVYDANGFLQRITTNLTGVPATEKILYEATSANGYGQIKSFRRVDALNAIKSYYYNIPTGYTTPGIQDLTVTYNYTNGNVMARHDNIANTHEDFTYDAIDRLIKAAPQKLGVGGTVYTPLTMTYDNNFWGSFGRLMTKSDVGTYTYTAAPRNAVKSVTDPATMISHQTQDIAYTPFFKTSKITEIVGGVPYEQDYLYDADDDRIYGKQLQGGAVTRNRWYMGDFEIDNIVSAGTTKMLHYIYGDAGLVGIVVKDAAGFNYYAAYTDHLGSIVAITNTAGTVVTRQSYDAWGRERNPDDWSYTMGIGSKPDWLYRGYTGHEMLPEYGLINMNGRMYDPLNGRMLRPDNFIQEPWNAQSYNRYSYCQNNPMKYSDPSGEVFGVDDVVLGLIGGGINVLTNLGSIHSVGQGLGFFGIGFVAGAASEYISPAGSAALMSAGNAALAGYIRDGKVDMNEVIKAGIIGGLTATVTAGISSAVTPQVTKLLPKIASPVLKEALVQAIVTAPIGAVGGGMEAAANGTNIGEGAAKGFLFTFGTSFAGGALNGLRNARIENIGPWTGRPTVRPPTPEVEPLPTKGIKLSYTENNSVPAIEQEQAPVHGNSLKSQKPTWGYKLYSTEDGVFLKNGITSKPIPETRYTKSFMFDKVMGEKILFPNRAAAYQWEYQQNLIQRGPLNKNMH